MAKIIAHGSIVGTIVMTTSQKRYMSDGVILKNYGQGWKLHGKCKVSPQQAYQTAHDAHIKFEADRPALAAYRKELHSLAGLGKAWKLHAALQLLGDDIDGVWSECCDGYGDNIHADVDEIDALARLYRVAVAESHPGVEAVAL